jgi:ParB family chromosome partitioning protein
MPEDSLNPRKRGLGRGLNALFESEEGVYPQADSEGQTPGVRRKTLNIEQLIPNPAQPRKFFEDSAIEELAASLKQYGILQPLLVRPVQDNSEQFEIIAGERRWRAAQWASLHEVPVVIRELDDSTVLQIGLVENLQREDLSPLEEAEGYRALIEEFGHTQAKVAELVGKSRSYVTNMLRLLGLPERVQKMVSQGEISSGHARTLLSAENPEALAAEIVAKGLTVRQLEKAVSEEKQKQKEAKPSSAKPKEKDADSLALEREFSDLLGMDFKVQMRGENYGHIQINFKSFSQLEYLLQILRQRPSV